ncbi:MAG: radical SAM protein [Verrucomicrobia bacterium]|nr:radical SAM protein [Verrucomicrobiota bacterium]
MDPKENFRKVRMVIGKVTTSCNLRCKYCCTDAVPLTKPGATMTMATHKRAVSLLVGNTQNNEVQWIFHGGEPMLLSVAWYEEAIEHCIAVAEANPHLKRLMIGMQSNLTRLSPEHLALIKKYRIQVGTSLDGPPQLSDVYRQGGKRVEESIELLHREGAPAGVIALINKNTIKHLDEVVDYFDQKGFGVTFNATCPTGRGTNLEDLTGDELFAAKRAVLERADKSGNRRLLSPDLAKQIVHFHTGQRDLTERTCHDYNCGAGVSLIGLNPNGDLWPCGRSSDANLGRFGNVNDPDTFAGYQATLTKFHEKDPWYARCFGCAAKLICMFGCTAFDKESIPTREMDCRATKLLYQYFCDHPDLIARLFERIQLETQKMKQEVAINKPPPPFLRLHTGDHPCSGCTSCAPQPMPEDSTVTIELSAKVGAAVQAEPIAFRPRFTPARPAALAAPEEKHETITTH